MPLIQSDLMTLLQDINYEFIDRMRTSTLEKRNLEILGELVFEMVQNVRLGINGDGSAMDYDDMSQWEKWKAKNGYETGPYKYTGEAQRPELPGSNETWYTFYDFDEIGIEGMSYTIDLEVNKGWNPIPDDYRAQVIAEDIYEAHFRRVGFE
jgi:hypothetical protein|tara:strand:+ start:993 stop:1448 length:456 start_codon:yes stop_codon:yes gene_type:complete